MQVNIPISSSWRTSTGGIVALVTSLLSAWHLIQAKNYNYGDPAWTATLAGIASAIGLLFARDHVVSSEEAGLKGPVDPEANQRPAPLQAPTVILPAFRVSVESPKPGPSPEDAGLAFAQKQAAEQQVKQ